MATIKNGLINDTIEKHIEQLKEELGEIEILDYDPLRVYFNEDYIIEDKENNQKFKIMQPTIQDFIDYGEKNIRQAVSAFCTNTTAYRVQLWDCGMDWNKIENQELFNLLLKTSDPKYTSLFFGDLELKKFELYVKTLPDGTTENVLYDKYNDVLITEDTRKKMCKYIQCIMASPAPEEEFTKNRLLKQELINNDRQKQLMMLKENKHYPSLLSLISFCTNHPGFKYKKNELRDVGIFEFMDSVQRLQIYEATKALFSGMYSGMCDLSKIPKNEFNFMRDVSI